MPEYVCIKPCWHGGHLYRLGERVDAEPTDLPKHFELVETKRGRGRPRQEESQVSPAGTEVRVNEKTIRK